MNKLHQLKSLKTNWKKELSRKAAHSCHKVQPNSAMKMAEESLVVKSLVAPLSPKTSATFAVPWVYSI